MAELYAKPGQLIVGTDSHTPHSGALGCVAFGVGTTDIANVFMTGAVRMVMPEGIRIELVGKLPSGVTAGHCAPFAGSTGHTVGARVFEFVGPVVNSLSIDERATLTNMTAELGGFTGLVAPYEVTLRIIRERREECELEDWVRSDEDAAYAERFCIEVSTLSSMLARPCDPGNGIELAALTEPSR